MAEPHPIPLVYRILFSFVEPTFASLGALAGLFDPSLLRAATPNALATIPSTLYPLFIAQSGAWFTLVFSDLVILTFSSYSRDPEIWRLILSAGLVSDSFYLTSIFVDLGVKTFFDLREWDFDIAFTMITTLIPMGAKVCAALGIGLKKKSIGGNGIKGKGKKD